MLPLYSDFIIRFFIIIITSYRPHHLFQMGTELGYFFYILCIKDLSPNVCLLFAIALVLLIISLAEDT